MTRAEFHKKAHLYLGILIAFLLPFKFLTPALILLLTLNWLIEGDFKNKFTLFLSNKAALLFTGLYVCHVVGLLYTENISAGLFDLQVKLSLLVFPIIFSTRPLSGENVVKVIQALIAGLILISCILLVRAIFNYLVFDYLFYYTEFSMWTHPSYLSMYLNMGIFYLIINIRNSDRVFIKYLLIALIFLFTITIILLTSKAGLLSLAFLYTACILHYAVSQKKIFRGLLLLIIFIGTVGLAIMVMPQMKERFQNASAEMASRSTEKVRIGNTSIRVMIWEVSNSIIKEHFLFGVGTGDSKDALIEKYRITGMQDAIDHDLNAHNQYYQTFIGLGLIGFLFLMAGLIIALRAAFTAGNYLYVCFILLLMFNFLAESMLETQAGVIFYAFFNSLLFFSIGRSEKFSNLKKA